jgi:hypothetical protein
LARSKGVDARLKLYVVVFFQRANESIHLGKLEHDPNDLSRLKLTPEHRVCSWPGTVEHKLSAFPFGHEGIIAVRNPPIEHIFGPCRIDRLNHGLLLVSRR